jgi:Cu/Ag efflux protein CusF
MKIQIFLVMAAVAMMARPALAQPQTSVEVTKGAGTATVTGTAKVTATVVEIDPATRTVTLKDKKGHIVDVEVGEEARNFDQLKVGDVVTTEYREAMSLSLSKTSGPRSASERTMEQRSAPGAKPGGTIGREITVMADVVAVNAKAKTVTLKGPHNTVDVIVEDPEQMKNIRKGDQVQVVYTEAVAISVTPGMSK